MQSPPGHKPFPGNSCSQMSTSRTGNENILLRFCPNPQLIPSPRLLVLSDQHRNLPHSPCGYNTWIFHSRVQDFLQDFLPLSGASQAAASSLISVHQLLPLGWGFPPWPGPAQITGIRKSFNCLGSSGTWGWFGLGPCSRMSFSQEYLQKTNSTKEGKPLQN